MKENKITDVGRDGSFDILKGTIERRIRFLSAFLCSGTDSSEKASIIRATKIHGNYRYYYKKPGGKEKETYLPAKQIGIARELAQREYDEKVAEAARKEVCLLQKYLTFAETGNISRIYAQLSEGRKSLVKPAYPVK